MTQVGAGPVVRVEPIGVTFRLAEGETLIQAAWRQGYDWPTVCGGRAECTACHVLIEAAGKDTPSRRATTSTRPR